jgi:hypothetical protein
VHTITLFDKELSFNFNEAELSESSQLQLQLQQQVHESCTRVDISNLGQHGAVLIPMVVVVVVEEQKGASNAGELQHKVPQKQRVTLKTFMDQNNPPGAQYMYECSPPPPVFICSP